MTELQLNNIIASVVPRKSTLIHEQKARHIRFKFNITILIMDNVVLISVLAMLKGGKGGTNCFEGVSIRDTRAYIPPEG